MKKFGFGKKSDKKSPAPSSDNPYAQQGPSSDPYANDPNVNAPPMAGYQMPRAGLPSGPRPGGGGLPGGPSPRVNGGYGAPPAPRPNAQPSGGYGTSMGANESFSGGYGSSATSFSSNKTSSAPKPGYGPSSGGYGDDKYGSSGGYGGSRYDNSGSLGQNQGRTAGPGLRGPGGYGGMAGPNLSNQDAPDTARDELFGAKPRNAPPQDNRYRQPAQLGTQSGPGYGAMGRNDSDANRDALFAGTKDRQAARQEGRQDDLYGAGKSGVSGGSYGGYGEERELTEEEKQELQAQNVEQEVHSIVNDDISSLQRTLALMNQSVEVGAATNERLAHQGERLMNAQRNMDTARKHNAEAYQNTKDLKRINGSMLSALGGNPFTKGKRRMQKEQGALGLHEDDVARQAETREKQMAHARVAQAAMSNKYGAFEFDEDEDTEEAKEGRKKYGLEDDEELDMKNKQIDDMLKQGSVLVGQMKQHAINMGTQVEDQNKIMDDFDGQIDVVGTEVARNRHRLERIR